MKGYLGYQLLLFGHCSHMGLQYPVGTQLVIRPCEGIGLGLSSIGSQVGGGGGGLVGLVCGGGVGLGFGEDLGAGIGLGFGEGLGAGDSLGAGIGLGGRTGQRKVINSAFFNLE